jgi:hypothetical protein
VACVPRWAIDQRSRLLSHVSRPRRTVAGHVLCHGCGFRIRHRSVIHFTLHWCRDKTFGCVVSLKQYGQKFNNNIGRLLGPAGL